MKVQRVWRTEVEVEMAVAKLLNVAQLTFNWSLTVDKNKTGNLPPYVMERPPCWDESKVL
jgi:hypothetical protein